MLGWKQIIIQIMINLANCWNAAVKRNYLGFNRWGMNCLFGKNRYTPQSCHSFVINENSTLVKLWGCSWRMIIILSHFMILSHSGLSCFIIIVVLNWKISCSLPPSLNHLKYMEFFTPRSSLLFWLSIFSLKVLSMVIS